MKEANELRLRFSLAAIPCLKSSRWSVLTCTWMVQKLLDWSMFSPQIWRFRLCTNFTVLKRDIMRSFLLTGFVIIKQCVEVVSIRKVETWKQGTQYSVEVLSIICKIIYLFTFISIHISFCKLKIRFSYIYKNYSKNNIFESASQIVLNLN